MIFNYPLLSGSLKNNLISDSPHLNLSTSRIFTYCLQYFPNWQPVGLGVNAAGHFSVCRKSLKTMVAFLIGASLRDNTEVIRYDVIPGLGVRKVLLLRYRIGSPLSNDYVLIAILMLLLIYPELFLLPSCH